MRRLKIFWILLVLILFILPVQGFGEEKEYSPEEIIKLFHDAGYRYCSDENMNGDIWGAIVQEYGLGKFIFPSEYWNKRQKKDEDDLEDKLVKTSLILEGTPDAFSYQSYIIFRNYKIINTKFKKIKDVNLKIVKVSYTKIGKFYVGLLYHSKKGCKAGFCFEEGKETVDYYFIKTDKGWRLFFPSAKIMKTDLYLLPVPVCAIIKQYKVVYLEVANEDPQSYISETIPDVITPKIKKEILTVIKALEKIKKELEENSEYADTRRNKNAKGLGEDLNGNGIPEYDCSG